jgi:hypothetical protein
MLSRFKFLLFILSFGLIQVAHAKIQLQPHQQVPVDYLVKNPGQKGILVYHSMGSGKTFLALDYIEKNPNMKVILFFPDFLKSNWIAQMKQFGVKNPSRYEMISFSESSKLLNRDLSQTIVVADEIHRFIQKLKTGTFESSDESIEVYEKLKTSRKILLLTGTPIFLDTPDISYIANLLVEEKSEFPIDPIKFRTQYMKVKTRHLLNSRPRGGKQVDLHDRTFLDDSSCSGDFGCDRTHSSSTCRFGRSCSDACTHRHFSSSSDCL